MSSRRKAAVISLSLYLLVLLISIIAVPGILSLWPHLFILALQEPLGGVGETQLWISLAIGAIIMPGAAWLIGPRQEPENWAYYRWIAFLSYGSLLIVTALAFALAKAAGWVYWV